MLAFTDTTVSKEALVASLDRHAAQDHLIQGHGYWKDGKGCAVGCSLVDFGADPSDHAAYEPLFGIPRILARLEDGIFEALPREDAKAWPLRFASAVKPGSDLSMVWPKFAHWMLVDKDHGVVKFAKEKSKIAIEAVADLFARQIAGETIDREQFRKAAAAAAYAADADAAYAADADAAYAYAAYAAYAYAAYASAAAADAAAYAYADAAAAADAYARGRGANTQGAREQARRAQADKLIELLEAA